MRPDDIIAIYFPNYHRTPHNEACYGEGCTEWELVKNAPSRFEGHHQPKVPVWGYYDEADPKWSARENDCAADHGITCWLVDWYWYCGVQLMHKQLERFDARVRAAGLPGMHFGVNIANVDVTVLCWHVGLIARAREAGFHSVFGYNISRSQRYKETRLEHPVADYSELLESHEALWKQCDGRELPFFPTETGAWRVAQRSNCGIEAQT